MGNLLQTLLTRLQNPLEKGEKGSVASNHSYDHPLNGVLGGGKIHFEIVMSGSPVIDRKRPLIT